MILPLLLLPSGIEDAYFQSMMQLIQLILLFLSLWSHVQKSYMLTAARKLFSLSLNLIKVLPILPSWLYIRTLSILLSLILMTYPVHLNENCKRNISIPILEKFFNGILKEKYFPIYGKCRLFAMFKIIGMNSHAPHHITICANLVSATNLLSLLSTKKLLITSK